MNKNLGAGSIFSENNKVFLMTCDDIRLGEHVPYEIQSLQFQGKAEMPAMDALRNHFAKNPVLLLSKATI